MGKVIRYGLGDYLNTKPKEQTKAFSYMNNGFTTLDENPSAKVETTPFVGDRSASGSITGYECVFPFECQLDDNEDVIMFIYGISRNQLTGEDAETDYVRADIFNAEEGGKTCPARLFRVAVEVTNVAGEGTQIVKISGNLHQVGDFTEGTFDVETRTFTPAAS